MEPLRGDLSDPNRSDFEQIATLFFLCFLEFLVFFSLSGIPCFLSVFPFFSREFRGSVGRKSPCFFGGFPCHFPKRQGKEAQGSDCNRNSKKSLRLRKHTLKPTLWTWDPPVLRGFYSVSEAPHRFGNPPRICCDIKSVIPNRSDFLAQFDFCDCGAAILQLFLREKLATSKLCLPIASDL